MLITDVGPGASGRGAVIERGPGLQLRPDAARKLRATYVRIRTLLIPAAIAMYIVLAAIVATNKLPWCDEGWYGAPAANLVMTGSLGTPGFFDGRLPGVRSYTYWEMPGFILLLAAWFKLAGIGLLQARLLTLLLGAVFLVIWGAILARLGASVWVRAITLALIGVDYFFVLDATYARSDMLSLVLLGTSLLAYLCWRESRLDLAVLSACAFAVAAGLTHPNAGLLTLIALGVIAARDWRRFGWRHAALAALPFVAGAALWASYISRAPDLFLAQFSQNASNRFSAMLQPWTAVLEEVGRYQLAFGLGEHSAATPAYVAVKAIIPVVWLVAIVACVMRPELRRHLATKTLLVILACFVVYYTFFEGTRTTYYLVWLVPVYSSIVAVWFTTAWPAGGIRRYAAAGIVLLVFAVQGAASLAKARQHHGMDPFQEVVSYLRDATPGQPFTASIEFGYAFGFLSNAYVDDVSLGAWSGLPTRYVVVDERYRAYLPEPRVPVLPEVMEAGRRLRESCTPVLDATFYTVYQCS